MVISVDILTGNGKIPWGHIPGQGTVGSCWLLRVGEWPLPGTSLLWWFSTDSHCCHESRTEVTVGHFLVNLIIYLPLNQQSQYLVSTKRSWRFMFTQKPAHNLEAMNISINRWIFKLWHFHTKKYNTIYITKHKTTEQKPTTWWKKLVLKKLLLFLLFLISTPSNGFHHSYFMYMHTLFLLIPL